MRVPWSLLYLSLSLTLFSPYNSYAGIKDCFQYFKNMVIKPHAYSIENGNILNAQKVVVLKRENLLNLKTFLSDHPELSHSPMYYYTPKEQVGFVYNQLIKNGFKEALEALPRDQSEFYTFVTLLNTQLGLSKTHVLNNLPDLYEMAKRSPSKDVKTFLKENIKLVNSLSEAQYFDLEKQTLLRLEESRAKDYARELFVKILPLEPFSPGQYEVQIASQSYRVERVKSGLILYVPKNMTKEPAWNSTDMMAVLKKIENGEPPPDNYRAEIGLDGFFYIQNGNHRITYDAREEIPLLFESGHISTMSLVTFLDQKYGSSLSNEQALELYRNQDKEKTMEFVKNLTSSQLYFTP